MRKFLGFTWLGWSNLLFFQWLTLRLFIREHTNTHVANQVGFVVGVCPMTRWRFSLPSNPDTSYLSVVLLERCKALASVRFVELDFVHDPVSDTYGMSVAGTGEVEITKWRLCFRRSRLKFHSDGKTCAPVECQG